MPPPKKSHLSNLSVIAYAMPPLLVGEALAVHIKHNFFANGSPSERLPPAGGGGTFVPEGERLSPQATERAAKKAPPPYDGGTSFSRIQNSRKNVQGDQIT